MATTHIYPPTQPRRIEPQQRSYTGVWGLIMVAILAAVAYGYYTTDHAMPATQELNATQAGSPLSPVADGTTSALTPSTMAPGTPDTTTTESSAIPIQGTRETR